MFQQRNIGRSHSTSRQIKGAAETITQNIQHHSRLLFIPSFYFIPITNFYYSFFFLDTTTPRIIFSSHITMRLSLLHLVLVGAALASPLQNDQQTTNDAEEGSVVSGGLVPVMQRSPVIPPPRPVPIPKTGPPKVPAKNPTKPGTKPNDKAEPPVRLGHCRRDDIINEDELIELGLWW
jgi:hypothetical protein